MDKLYLYKKDAQLLEISGQFPAEGQNISESAKKFLTPDEITLLEKQKLSLLLVRAEIKK